MMYLGDYSTGATIDFNWSSNNAAGASVTRATNGTVSVYKANSTTQSTSGITDTEDFDSLTGIHHCRIDTSADATFYAAGNDFSVVLSAATIDGQTVNAVLAHFSIQNRYQGAAAPAASAVADAVWDEARTGHTTAGTFGLYLDAQVSSAASPPSAASIADAVWDEAISGHLTAGSTGATLNTSSPTTSQIADAVWDEALSGHLVAGSAGNALNNAGGAAADPWETELPGSYTAGSAGWILGERLDAKVSAMSGSSPGAGAEEFVYTLTETGSGDPIPDADVWATNDSAGTQILASGRTNQSGVVTFYLDSGTVYIWRQKSGYNFTNPDTEVVP